jgi:hypothetical protein
MASQAPRLEIRARSFSVALVSFSISRGTTMRAIAATLLGKLRHVIRRRVEGRDPLKSVNEGYISELSHKLHLLQNEYKAELQALRLHNETQDAQLEALKAQVAHIYTRSAGIPREQLRLDFALGELEGLGKLYAELREARETAEFQSAFDDPSPLVTVITVTAHRPDLLVDRCLKSIREQTYRNLQILVVGDHCIDETPERVTRLNDARIEFHNLPKRGPYPKPGIDRWYVAGTNASNASRGLAKGKFITYLDDDDKYEPNRIEMLLAVAQEQRAEFLWHKFWYLQPCGTWALWGNGNLEHGEVGTSMIFYHNFFLKLPWDLHAYRVPEPGDWNRIRKIKHLRPRMAFVDRPLTWYYKNYDASDFIPHDSEDFLE